MSQIEPIEITVIESTLPKLDYAALEAYRTMISENKSVGIAEVMQLEFHVSELQQPTFEKMIKSNLTIACDDDYMFSVKKFLLKNFNLIFNGLAKHTMDSFTLDESTFEKDSIPFKITIIFKRILAESIEYLGLERPNSTDDNVNTMCIVYIIVTNSNNNYEEAKKDIEECTSISLSNVQFYTINEFKNFIDIS